MSKDNFTPETEEARLAQLVSLSWDLAEKRIREGTASSQLLTQILKMGSIREQIELENLRQQNRLSQAKTEALNKEANADQTLIDAIEAMKKYGRTS